MGWSEALSDTGEQTGRGSAVVRGSITGGMTALGGIFHTLPFLISDVHKALIVAGVVVAVELFVIAWVRKRFLDVSMRSSLLVVTVGGVIVARDRRRDRLLLSALARAARRAAGDGKPAGTLALFPKLTEGGRATMRAVDALMECLKAEGVDVVFGLPGGANLPTYDALRTTAASATSSSATRRAAATPPRATRRRPARSASRSPPAAPARPT